MKQRAPYKCEVFDYEDAEVYGTIFAVQSLAGAALRFVGWDETGTVAWDTDNPTSIPATVVVTDAAERTYAATVGPLPACTTPRPREKVYSWEVQRTNVGQRAVLVWGFLTVTPSPPVECHER